jgi:hypothetical protein
MVIVVVIEKKLMIFDMYKLSIGRAELTTPKYIVLIELSIYIMRFLRRGIYACSLFFLYSVQCLLCSSNKASLRSVTIARSVSKKIILTLPLK